MTTRDALTILDKAVADKKVSRREHSLYQHAIAVLQNLVEAQEQTQDPFAPKVPAHLKVRKENAEEVNQ